MRCMPFVGCQQDWTKTPGCLWSQVRNCSGFPLLGRAKKTERCLERTNPGSLAAKPGGDGTWDGYGILVNGRAGTCRRDCLSEAAIVPALSAGIDVSELIWCSPPVSRQYR